MRCKCPPHYLYLQLAIEEVQHRFLKYLSFEANGVERRIDYTIYRYSIDMAWHLWDFSVNVKVYILYEQWCMESLIAHLLSSLNFRVPRFTSSSLTSYSFSLSRSNILTASHLATICHSTEHHCNDILILIFVLLPVILLDNRPKYWMKE